MDMGMATPAPLPDTPEQARERAKSQVFKINLQIAGARRQAAVLNSQIDGFEAFKKQLATEHGFDLAAVEAEQGKDTAQTIAENRNARNKT